MNSARYVCCQSGLELTFRLEYQLLPVETPAAFGRAGTLPGSLLRCQIRNACCLAVCETESGTCRLATPAERRDWGDWLLIRIELDRIMERAVERACLAAASETLPRARRTRVSARWKRAA